MARIVADRGMQFYQVPSGGSVRYHEFDLDCSCTLRMDERYITSVSNRDHMSALTRVADAHICEIEVFMVHTEAARLARTRAATAQRDNQRVDPALRYMGMDVARGPDSTAMWLANWQREIIGMWAPSRSPRRTPDEVERSVRENPAPRVSPEAVVQRATEQLGGVSLTGVIVDEVGPAPRVAPGAVAVELARRESLKDQPRPDRFDLIEID